jgi:DNA-binding response OmpR family regulator
LLVEDEVLVAALAADTLEELGYRAVEATTIKAALEIAADGKQITFAVIDIGLPDGRGDALAVQLLALRADMPIIIATGYGEAHLDARLRANPRIAVLSKPYDMAQLEAAIKAVHPSG